MAGCSYIITGGGISNPSALKNNYHYIDAQLVIPSSNQPDDNFAVACRSVGMGAILNNANDKGGGGRDTSWYQSRNAAGWMSAGGETNSDDEINAVMDSGLIYMDFAGWTGRDSLRSIYSEGIRKHGGGIVSWFETYDMNDGNYVPYATCGITPDVMANMAAQAHSGGAFEVGLLVAAWHLDWGVNPYLALASAIENEIGSFAGFMVWRGYDGISCDDCASIANGLISSLQSSWPPQTKSNIEQRRSGGGGITPPTPKPPMYDYAAVYSPLFD